MNESERDLQNRLWANSYRLTCGITPSLQCLYACIIGSSKDTKCQFITAELTSGERVRLLSKSSLIERHEYRRQAC